MADRRQADKQASKLMRPVSLPACQLQIEEYAC